MRCGSPRRSRTPTKETAPRGASSPKAMDIYSMWLRKALWRGVQSVVHGSGTHDLSQQKPSAGSWSSEHVIYHCGGIVLSDLNMRAMNTADSAGTTMTASTFERIEPASTSLRTALMREVSGPAVSCAGAASATAESPSESATQQKAQTLVSHPVCSAHEPPSPMPLHPSLRRKYAQPAARKLLAHTPLKACTATSVALPGGMTSTAEANWSVVKEKPRTTIAETVSLSRHSAVDSVHV
mmetsp:Transcript_29147/g.68216  ORF Transcript_29147/g.68216 Transcript_29147/m.68216 type:complete len:239 (-) Transcript_29147:203-919(-)